MHKDVKKTFYTRGVFQALVLTGLSVFMVAFLAGDASAIRVSLKRVVFDEKKRAEVLTIINNSGEEQTYRLGWRKYTMDEKKGLHALPDDDPGEGLHWADDMVRFAPRRITVAPGSSQNIRLFFRRPKDIEPVEYRSHLWIVTETKPQGFEDRQKAGKDKQVIRLAVQPAISLPVFVRVGALPVEASITDAKLTKPGKDELRISFVLNRKGSRSIYGDFDFTCLSGADKAVLRQVRGISVYTEVDKRALSYELPLTADQTACDSVAITYRADTADPDFSGKVMAESSARLGQ